jgi:hypothetical protein
VLSLEEKTMQTVSTNEPVQAIYSKGAVIQVTKLGSGIGIPLMTVACPDSTAFLSTLSSPVYSMQLRGFAGSRVAKA